ncbi:fungal trichothecene efflux pump [Phialemonium atrogriseum]|uniref:Fungal trichothecene efflux pump n=1 Tax=Phialemonium atrogriseum TaxID=1093897 RepID=A0AAJ0FJK3_9PEZI|nr:fungal trichothecene efflux pump [Phialemonium atrogriseum]KAK1764534.1 fungal trichothecene efflux pump [Phialemonium atrogriseum]
MAISNDKVTTDLSNHAENIQPVTPKADVYIPAEFSEVDNGEIAIEALGGTVHDLPPGYYRSFNFIGTILALCLGQICCYFGFVLPANVLGIINDDIGPNPNYVWTAMIWNLTQAVAFVLVGRLSDLLGRRWFLIIGNCIGLIGAIVACTARSIPVLIVGSALLGIAAGVQLSFGMVIGELIPNKYRGFGIASIFVAALPVTAFGPVIIRSMILHTAAGWRWSFYINIIINAIVIILFYVCYHPPTYEMLHARRQKHVPRWKMVDVVGVILFTAGLLVLLLGISWGGAIYPWKSGKVIGFIVGGAALLVILVLWEIWGAGEYPLIPMRLFRNRHYVGVIITASVGSMVYYSLLVLWPVQITVLYETTIMGVGWKSCVVAAAALIGQGLCGLLVKVLGKHKLQMVVSVSILTAFTGAMAATTPSTPTMAVLFIFFASLSLGYVETVALTIGPFCLKQEDLGLALGLLGATRSTLATTAQAVFSAILNNELLTKIPKYVIPAALDAGLPESSTTALLEGLAAGNFSAVPDITPAIIAATVDGNKEAYSQSFKIVYLAAIAFGVCGIIAALNAPNSDSKFTDIVPRKLHGQKLDAKLTEKEIAANEV